MVRLTTRLLALVAALLLALAGCGSGEEATTTSTTDAPTVSTPAEAPATAAPATSTTSAAPTTAVPTTSTTTPPPQRFSDLPTVTLGELPTEALDTLRLIRDGGPYPYAQDDSVFQNREGILPDHPRGFYREYTVDTPGLSHRGARRLVTGDDGAIYWTDDHYASFRELVPG